MRYARITTRGVLLLAIVFSVAGCASASTMPRAENIGADTQVAFGSAEVIINGERQKWGMNWSGESHFFLLILPEGTDKAISYDLSNEGYFYWPLAAGKYELLGYHWQKIGEQRVGEIRAEFVVPVTGEDVYVGTLRFLGTEYMLGTLLADEFEDATARFYERFSNRGAAAEKALMVLQESPGTVGKVLPPCHDSWKIECTDRYSGVSPESPEVSSSGFTHVDSLTPAFSWKGSARDDVTYDLIIYEAATYTTSGVVDSHIAGRLAIYVEGLTATSWRPAEPLKPDTRYYWSVRMRDGDDVSRWSTFSHFTFMIIASSSGFGQWFQFETP
jgi:hypothetical protein